MGVVRNAAHAEDLRERLNVLANWEAYHTQFQRDTRKIRKGRY